MKYEPYTLTENDIAMMQGLLGALNTGRAKLVAADRFGNVGIPAVDSPDSPSVKWSHVDELTWMVDRATKPPTGGGGNIDGGSYTPNDAHEMAVRLEPGKTTSVWFNAPGQVSAAIPEGANGGVGAFLNIAAQAGEKTKTVPGANLIGSNGRGLLANVPVSGAMFAVMWLPESATEPTEASFNIGKI